MDLHEAIEYAQEQIEKAIGELGWAALPHEAANPTPVSHSAAARLNSAAISRP
jgi:hypothetical protein